MSGIAEQMLFEEILSHEPTARDKPSIRGDCHRRIKDIKIKLAAITLDQQALTQAHGERRTTCSGLAEDVAGKLASLNEEVAYWNTVSVTRINSDLDEARQLCTALLSERAHFGDRLPLRGKLSVLTRRIF
jgi:alkanesulfonate monooxygenase SsuD/methylene tetrahydromethanopterin reductase-like flavin-dependent oxidoreductase (luciferase family)